MATRKKSASSIDFKFLNKYTNNEEVFTYYLDSEDIILAIKLYANFYGVNLDGTDNHIYDLFASLDSGRYEYINEVFDKIVECKYIKEDLEKELKEKAQEEFEEEAEVLDELNN